MVRCGQYDRNTGGRLQNVLKSGLRFYLLGNHSNLHGVTQSFLKLTKDGLSTFAKCAQSSGISLVKLSTLTKITTTCSSNLAYWTLWASVMKTEKQRLIQHFISTFRGLVEKKFKHYTNGTSQILSSLDTKFQRDSSTEA